VASFI